MEIEQRDHLTQLLTRAAFDAELSARFSAATSEQPAALVLADIDHFKKVNDNHGHPAGDAVLKELAGRLQHVIEGKGTVYRYGGEEFAAILPNHTGDEAVAVAERARRAVEALTVRSLSVTSSYGVAVVPLHASSPDQWLDAAESGTVPMPRAWGVTWFGSRENRRPNQTASGSQFAGVPIRELFRTSPRRNCESKSSAAVPSCVQSTRFRLRHKTSQLSASWVARSWFTVLAVGSMPNSQDLAGGDFRRRQTLAFGRRLVES